MENLFKVFLHFTISAFAFYCLIVREALRLRVKALAFKWNPDLYAIDSYYTLNLYEREVSKSLRPTVPWLLFFQPLKWIRSYKQILDSKSKIIFGSFNGWYRCCLVVNTNRWYNVSYSDVFTKTRKVNLINRASTSSIFTSATLVLEEDYSWVVQNFVPKHLRILAYKVLPSSTFQHPVNILLTRLPQKHQEVFQKYFIAKFAEHCRENFKAVKNI